MLAWAKRFIFKIWIYIPFGNICVFWYNNQRITFTKSLWLIVDSGRGTVADALPLSYVSEKMQEKITTVLRQRGYII